MSALRASFTLMRETKNTFRYEEDVEDGEEAIIGYLYIRKSAVDGPAPETVLVTVDLA